MNNNPFGNFNSMTPQTNYMMRSGMANINQSFSQPQPFIDRTDFKNKKNMLHNNLEDDIQIDDIYETDIYINSSDRTTSTYPSMFNFIVKFGGANVASGLGFPKTVVNPCIDQTYERIKYITLEVVSVSRTNVIVISGGGGVPISYSLSTNYDDEICFKNKMLVLSIEELKTKYVVGTGNLLASESFMLINDKTSGCNHNIWKPIRKTRTYPTSQLHKVNRLTFKLKDQYGNVLQYYDDSGNPFDITAKLAQLKTLIDGGAGADIKSEYQSLLNINKELEVIYVLIFGIYETEFNKIPQYVH
jgi:hypothetical protein